MKVTDIELIEAANQFTLYRHYVFTWMSIEEAKGNVDTKEQSPYWNLYIEAAKDFYRCVSSLMEPS